MVGHLEISAQTVEGQTTEVPLLRMEAITPRLIEHNTDDINDVDIKRSITLNFSKF